MFAFLNDASRFLPVLLVLLVLAGIVAAFIRLTRRDPDVKTITDKNAALTYQVELAEKQFEMLHERAFSHLDVYPELSTILLDDLSVYAEARKQAKELRHARERYGPRVPPHLPESWFR